MTRNRSTRTLASLAVTLSLALAAMATPVLGARRPPTSAPRQSSCLQVHCQPSGFIAYDVSFDLAPGETSNLSQLFLTAKTTERFDGPRTT